jgi:DNA repair exonuclease SbcCD ATPase subunit
MKSEWNKDLDIPVEVLFKYLCRDYRIEKALCKELEAEISRLKSELNYAQNNIAPIAKLQKKFEALKQFSREQEETIKRRNNTISQLRESNEQLRMRLEKYEEV